MAALPVYSHDILSLHDIDDHIFPLSFSNLDLNRGIAAGAPIDDAHLEHARAIARALKGHSDGGDPNVSAAMASKAQYRTDAIAAAHATATCLPVGILGRLQAIQDQQNDQFATINAHLATAGARLLGIDDRLLGISNRFQGVNNRLQGIDNRILGINVRLTAIELHQQTSIVMLAQAANTRIILKNESIKVIDTYSPLYKTIPGTGHGLAVAISPAANLLHLVAPVVIPNVGELPPNFNSNISNYTHQQILDLVTFYHNNFGIAAADGVKKRAEKFSLFLQTY